MSAWAIEDTAETWQDVCDRAWAGEPQFVSCGPSQTVVVVSYVDYRPTKPVWTRRGAWKLNTLPEAMGSCPCGEDVGPVTAEDSVSFEKTRQQSARELLGYGARFHKLRTTEEWMQELREGETV